MSCSFKVTSSLVAQLVESACNAGDLGSIPGLRRFPGAGKGYPLQYSGLENSVDYTVHEVRKSWTRLSDFCFFLPRSKPRTPSVQFNSVQFSSFQSLSHVQLFMTPRTVPCQAPPSMGSSRQEHWSGLPLPTPGDLPRDGTLTSVS